MVFAGFPRLGVQHLEEALEDMALRRGVEEGPKYPKVSSRENVFFMI